VSWGPALRLRVVRGTGEKLHGGMIGAVVAVTRRLRRGPFGAGGRGALWSCAAPCCVSAPPAERQKKRRGAERTKRLGRGCHRQEIPRMEGRNGPAELKEALRAGPEGGTSQPSMAGRGFAGTIRPSDAVLTRGRLDAPGRGDCQFVDFAAPQHGLGTGRRRQWFGAGSWRRRSDLL